MTARSPASWLRACTDVGVGAQLHGRPFVSNHGQTRIGAHFRLSSLPVASHLVVGPQGDLEIGDGVSISYGAAISCHARVRIGGGTRIGPFMVLADSDFHVVGSRDRAPEPRPIEIGRDVQIGARVTVLPGTRIGDGARVSAGSTVAGVVAARTVVSGVPARVGGATDPASASGSLGQRVREAVGRALGLAAPPALDSGPTEIPEWDSLGALRVLLALEDEFGVRLSEQQMVRVQRIADLVANVESRATPRR